MTNKSHQRLAHARIKECLLPNDVAFILDSDITRIAHFESGMAETLSFINDYDALFCKIRERNNHRLDEHHLEDLKDRCFQLLEKLEEEASTIQNEKRKKALHRIIGRLTPTDDEA